MTGSTYPPRSGAPVVAGIVVRGALTMALTLTALLIVTFALASMSPIDPAVKLLGDHFSAASYAEMRHTLGLDLPWPEQLLRYVTRLAHGDLGMSLSTGQPVAQDLARVLPATFELATIALLLSTVVGLGLGILGAWHPRGIIDGVVRCVSLAGNSVPMFWLGLLCLFMFYARLHWSAGPGRIDDGYEYTIDMPTGVILYDAWHSGMPGALRSAAAHLVLPTLLLSLYAIGSITRLTRAALLGELGREYVTLARATGSGGLRVLIEHVLPNVVGVVLTVIALTYASLLEGAVLTETVFARPGLGRYLTTALFAADLPAILGSTLVIGVCFVTINGLTDLMVRLADPRLR